jgi:hypothetical protein
MQNLSLISLLNYNIKNLYKFILLTKNLNNNNNIKMQKILVFVFNEIGIID